MHIRSIFQESGQTYGSPRVHRELRDEGVNCGERRVARLMRQHGIRPEPVKRFVGTTDSKHALPVAENLLDRQFGPEAADACWSCDITYLWTGEGWLYLSVVLDLFSRRIIGWSMPL